MAEHETVAGDFPWPPTDEERASMIPDLKEGLGYIEELDADYEPRNALVLMALAVASLAGLDCGIAIDPAEPDWPVAYIELPTGQVSWHLPAHKVPYDGHSTQEKYARIKAYLGEDK